MLCDAIFKQSRRKNMSRKMKTKQKVFKNFAFVICVTGCVKNRFFRFLAKSSKIEEVQSVAIEAR